MKSANRVQESTTGTGTGALPLQGNTPRMRTVAGAGYGNGAAFWGLVEHSTALEWEISRCTVNGGAITRDMVRDGSLGGGNLVPFSAGTKTISVIGPVLPLRTAVNDQDYAATVVDRLIAFTALTAARTVMLPAAATFEPGQLLMIVDAAGAASQAIPISVAPTGTDTIAGSNTAQVGINLKRGRCWLVSNGVDGWDVLVWSVIYLNAPQGDVLINDAGLYFDGPSCPQAAVGVWRARGQVTCLDTAGGAEIDVKLWDGTTVSGFGAATTGAANAKACIGLSAVITAPAANIRMSVHTGTTTGKILWNTSGAGIGDSALSVERVG